MCAGGAENIPTFDAELAAEFAPAGTAYVVLTDENNDVCCSGGVGYRDQNTVLLTSHKAHNSSAHNNSNKNHINTFICWNNFLFYSHVIQLIGHITGDSVSTNITSL